MINFAKSFGVTHLFVCVSFLRFWRGKEGPASCENITPFLNKYIANQTLLITDGNRAYLSYFLKNPAKLVQLYQLSHGKGEFSRKEKHTDLDGSFSF